MARNQGANSYVENTTAVSGRGAGAEYYELELYNDGLMYVIRG